MSADAASKHFINREFALAVAELGPLPFPPQAKPWILYFALCDRAFAEPDRPAWPLNGQERKALRAAVVKGTFWESIMLAWGAAVASVPVAVITAGMSVTAKHVGDAAPAVQFAEAYLAEIDDEYAARSVATAFIMHVLVELQHDYFYARQLVGGERFAVDEAQRARVLALIAEHETQYLARQEEEAQLLARQEQERVAAAIAEAQRQTQTASTAEAAASTNASTNASTAAAQPPAPRPGDGASRRTQISRPSRGLTQVWRAWFREFIRSQSFYNLLALFFLVCSLASSSGLRRQAARFRTWLWAVIMQSLKMGLTVTYL